MSEKEAAGTLDSPGSEIKPKLQLVVGTPGKAPRPKSKRDVPMVRVDSDLDLVVNECCREIALHPDVYQRNGKLVSVVSGNIREIAPATLREMLCSVATFVKPSKGTFGPPKVPNDHVVQAVYHRGEWGGRSLSGVSNAPFMRPDGTIFQSKGYDPETSFLFAPTEAFPTIEDRPSIEDARGALADVLEPLQDFPFREIDGRSPSLSAYIALLMTLVIRPAIKGVVPGWLISANTRGTGKTFLARIASIIASGENPEPLVFSKDDDEIRKKITSKLKVGQRFVMFDNVKRPVGGESIEIALTSPVWGDRDLGTMTSLSLANNAVFAFTGNNLQTEQDASRRFVPVDLETRAMSPEDRESFRIADIMSWTKENRPKLVAALLTIARAWWVAGQPRMGVRALGGFEGWSATVPPMLAWMGVTSPLEARRTSAATEDRDRLDLVRLADWWEGFLAAYEAHEGATVAGLMSFLYPMDKAKITPRIAELRDDLEAVIGQSGKAEVTRALGYRLRSTRRRVIDETGRYLDTGSMLKGSPRWLVRRPEVSQPVETDD